jgi:hypothetical protein
LRRYSMLPDWLTAGAQPARVTAALEAAVPEIASRDWSIVACDPKLRLKGGNSWTASVQLQLEGRGGDACQIELAGEYRPARTECQQSGRVRGSLGEPGWEVELPALGLTLRTRPHDEALPALSQLTDPAAARSLLEESVRARRPGIHIEACTPEVMRYKPGSRCTVRYRLDYGSGARSGPPMIVAKTYRGGKGENAYKGMLALDRAGIPRTTVALAEPIAFLPELNVLLQGPVDEQETLKALVARAFTDCSTELLTPVRDAVAKTADGLVALHASSVDHGELVNWSDELLEVRELIDRLSVPVPEMAGAAYAYLEALESLSEAHDPDPAGPAHRSFRPAQVLLSEGGIGFIDFDGLCTAEPAIDLALFRAAVRDVGMRSVTAGGPAGGGARIATTLRLLDEICDDFLARYRAAHLISLERVALWESLDLLTFVLHCWTKLKPAWLPHRMAMLEHHLRTTPLLR